MEENQRRTIMNTTTEQNETYHHESLKVADRCDTGDCGAQAFVRVHFQHGYIDFCGHHFNDNEVALFASFPYAVVQDERHRINSKPSPSASPDDDEPAGGLHAA